MNRNLSKYKSKIDVRLIIRDHFNSLKNANTNKAGIDDYISFLIIPIIFAIIFVYLGFNVDKDSIETIVASLAIFVGLLFNAMVILLDTARRQGDKRVKEVIQEITANISFSILVSFSAILVMLLGFIDNLPEYVKNAIDFISFFFLLEFLLIFLMVLKRLYLIFIKELT